MTFDGFPEAALDFYDDLEIDNSKVFWDAHKDTYRDAVAAPMAALCAGLAAEFGEAKAFRPYRDVRFSKDKTPYKTHQGWHVRRAPACGWYAEVNADEFVAGGGFYHAEPEALAAVRAAIDNERRGEQLRAIIDELQATGWQVLGDRIKTAPRGYDKAHPRIELLRHRSLFVLHEIEPDVLGEDAVIARVAELWRETAELVAWQSEVLQGQ